MPVLRRKVLRVLPVWLIVLLLIPTAAAAYVWISNQISSTVVVSSRPIFLLGSFTSGYVEEPLYESIPYYVNDVSNSSGYIIIKFTTYDVSYVFTGTEIELDLTVQDDSMIPFEDTAINAVLISGFNYVTFVIESASGGPIDFSNAGSISSGYFEIQLTYKLALADESLLVNMQITDRL